MPLTYIYLNIEVGLVVNLQNKQRILKAHLTIVRKTLTS